MFKFNLEKGLNKSEKEKRGKKRRGNKIKNNQSSKTNVFYEEVLNFNCFLGLKFNIIEKKKSAA